MTLAVDAKAHLARAAEIAIGARIGLHALMLIHVCLQELAADSGVVTQVALERLFLVGVCEKVLLHVSLLIGCVVAVGAFEGLGLMTALHMSG